MIDGLLDTPSLWEKLQDQAKPLFLYGMGNGAEKILAACKTYGIAVEGVFASDEYVRGHDFAGYRVMRYSEILDRYGGDILILLAFAARDEALIARILAMAERHTLYVPDVPVYGGGLFDRTFVEAHTADMERVAEMLADEASRRLYKDVLRFKWSGDTGLLGDITTPKEEIYRLLALGEGEIYADLGAYTGDTVEEASSYAASLSGIIAVEPDPRNYARLTARMDRLGLSGIAQCHNIGAWSGAGEMSFDPKSGRGASLAGAGGKAVKLDSLDNLVKGGRVSFIKIDVEGADLMALKGCEKTIRRWRPKLLLSLYHRNEDIFTLPLKVRELCPDYRLYLGRHMYLPAWDFELGAVATN